MKRRNSQHRIFFKNRVCSDHNKGTVVTESKFIETYTTNLRKFFVLGLNSFLFTFIPDLRFLFSVSHMILYSLSYFTATRSTTEEQIVYYRQKCLRMQKNIYLTLKFKL